MSKLYSVKLKIITIFLGVTLIALSAFVSISYFSTTNVLREQVNDNISTKTKLNADLVGNWMKEKVNEVETHANNPLVKSMDIDVIIPYLRNDIKNKRDEYDVFLVADLDGNFVTTNEDNNTGSIKEREYFQEVLKGKTVLSEPVLAKSTGNPVVVIASPIMNEKNQMVGIMAGVLDLEKLSDMIASIDSNDKDIYSFIVSQDGNAIAHPIKDIIMQESIPVKSEIISEDFVKVAATILDQDSGFVSYPYKGETVYCYFSKIANTNNWTIVTRLPENKINEPVKTIVVKLVYLSVGTIIAIVIVGFFIAKLLADPISQLKDEIDKVEKFDLQDINTDRKLKMKKDEIGLMARSIFKMKNSLRLIVASIKEVTDQTFTQANALNTSTQKNCSNG
ncbi:MAG: methyl-accepting chemotaxis protein [Bacillaceae bacterium]|nr:methyl-accepting chemotaxis protein [Bacillaceae bacterium]